MRPISLLQRVDLAARKATPGMLTLFLVLFSVTPLMIPSYGVMAAALPLPALFCWAVWRPGLMPAWLVFLLGLVYGALLYAPLGLHSLLFLLFHVVVRSQRRILVGVGFLVFWALYALTVLAFSMGEWMLTSIVEAYPMPITSAFFRALITAAIFPVLMLPLAQVHRATLRRV